jgi:hypothetical protein
MARNPDRVGAVTEMTEALRAAIREELDRATRTCLNCERFTEATETCGKWNARPPARVIAAGCEDHVDEIPF